MSTKLFSQDLLLYQVSQYLAAPELLNLALTSRQVLASWQRSQLQLTKRQGDSIKINESRFSQLLVTQRVFFRSQPTANLLSLDCLETVNNRPDGLVTIKSYLEGRSPLDRETGAYWGSEQLFEGYQLVSFHLELGRLTKLDMYGLGSVDCQSGHSSLYPFLGTADKVNNYHYQGLVMEGDRLLYGDGQGQAYLLGRFLQAPAISRVFNRTGSISIASYKVELVTGQVISCMYYNDQLHLTLNDQAVTSPLVVNGLRFSQSGIELLKSPTNQLVWSEVGRAPTLPHLDILNYLRQRYSLVFDDQLTTALNYYFPDSR